MRVRYTPRAFAERERIFSYLEARNPQAARRVVGLIRGGAIDQPFRLSNCQISYPRGVSLLEGRHARPGLIRVDLTGAPSAVQGGFEDDKRSIGAGAASPDSLRIVLVQASDVRFFGAGLRPQASRGVCEIAKPILYLGRCPRGALYGAKRGHDVGINAIARVGARFAMGLEPSNILVDALADGVADHRLAAIATRHIRKPRARRVLRLGKGQDVLAFRIGDVVGSSDRLMASTMVGVVVPRDPRPAFAAPPVSDRQAFGDRSPLGFSPRIAGV